MADNIRLCDMTDMSALQSTVCELVVPEFFSQSSFGKGADISFHITKVLQNTSVAPRNRRSDATNVHFVNNGPSSRVPRYACATQLLCHLRHPPPSPLFINMSLHSSFHSTAIHLEHFCHTAHHMTSTQGFLCLSSRQKNGKAFLDCRC